MSEKLINLARARETLQREKLDGLIAAQPINQYYASGYWGIFNTPVGYEGSYFACLPLAETEPASLVLPALEIRRLETMGGTWMPGVVAYSAPGEAALLADGSPRGQDYSGWPVRAAATLTPLEERWVRITRELGSRMSPDAFHGLRRAIEAAGLANADVLVDDHRLQDWLSAAGLTRIRCHYRPQLFNQIRMVKTAAEIELMRTAARINEQSLLAAAAALHDGALWHEIENVYMAEMAGRGGRGVYLMCGVGELPAGQIRPGEPVLLDALGQFERYHGDFGRCAVLGAAQAEHRERHRALLAGWEAALEILRPGRRYSEVSRHVGDAVRRAGIAGFRDPIVHGLGLEHTDDPKPFGVQPQYKEDQVLAAGMVVNVDMPHTEIGWGSVHMEDTVQITADGCERLGQADFGLLEIV